MTVANQRLRLQFQAPELAQVTASVAAQLREGKGKEVFVQWLAECGEAKKSKVNRGSVY